MTHYPEVPRISKSRKGLALALFSGFAFLLMILWPGIASLSIIPAIMDVSSEDFVLAGLGAGLVFSLGGAMRHEWNSGEHPRRYYRHKPQQSRPKNAEERAAEAIHYLKSHPFSETRVREGMFFDLDAAESRGYCYISPRFRSVKRKGG